MLVIVHADAIVHPWTVVVFAGYAATAAPAVLAAQWLSYHTCGAKVLIVECIRFQKGIDGLLSLAARAGLGYEAWIGGHGYGIEEGGQTICEHEGQIEEEM